MPKNCNCASATCSCQIAGAGNAHIDGVGSETNPYTITVDPTRTDYVNSSTVTWSPVTGAGTEASPYQVTASAAGGIPSGGSTGQYLAKKSSTNFDMQWISTTVPPMLSAFAAATSGLASLNAIPTDVPGMTVTINVPSTASVFLVSAVFDFQNTVTGVGTADGAITVEGGIQSAHAFFNQDSQTVNQRATVHAQARVTGLSAGNRVFKGQASATTGTAYRVNTIHSTIMVWQIA